MTEMWGADVKAMRQLAKDMASAGGVIREIEPTLTSQLLSGSWQGPDQQEFEADWLSRLAPDLIKAADFLAERADVLLANADAQEATSLDEGGSTSSTGPWTDFGPIIPDVPFPFPHRSGPADTLMGNFPDWVGNLRDGLGMFIDGSGALLKYLEVARGIPIPTWLNGVSSVAGGATSAFAVVEGGYEMARGWDERNGWAMGDGAVTAGLGAAGLILLASNPVGWGAAAGLAIAGGVWWGLQQLTPDGMETTEWIAKSAGDAWNATTETVSDAWNATTEAVNDAVDNTVKFIDDVTQPLQDLWPW